jgi:hypothetical protein
MKEEQWTLKIQNKEPNQKGERGERPNNSITNLRTKWALEKMPLAIKRVAFLNKYPPG